MKITFAALASSTLKKSFLALGLGIALVLSAQSSLAQDKTPALIVDEIDVGKAEIAKLFSGSIKPVLKGATKIAIPIFTVETVVKTGAGIRQESGSGSVSQNTTYFLEGVPQAQMQAAIDKLYDGLVADLQAMGFEVISPEQIKATAAYQKSAPSYPNPHKHEGSNAEALVYAAKGLSLGLSNSRFIQTRQMMYGSGGLLGMAQAMGTIASQINDASVAGAVAQELGVAALVVQIPLEFVEQSVKGSNFFGNASAEVSSRLRLSISRSALVSAGQGNEGTGLVTAAPFILGGTPVKEVKDTSSLAVNAGLMALSMMAGSKSSTRITEKTAIAHPTLYVESVANGVGKFNKIIIAALQGMR